MILTVGFTSCGESKKELTAQIVVLEDQRKDLDAELRKAKSSHKIDLYVMGKAHRREVDAKYADELKGLTDSAEMESLKVKMKAEAEAMTKKLDDDFLKSIEDSQKKKDALDKQIEELQVQIK